MTIRTESSPKQGPVVVAMSGGVDSSVTALLLKQQGYDVIGLFMKNWEESGAGGTCPAQQDYDDVARVAEALDIPYYTVNFAQEYWDGVFEDFLRDYRAGLTPNPDILCNKEIKFKHLLKKARELGAAKLATGHYCQVINNQLVKGHDPNKDQSYFLHAISGDVLKDVLFPIGHLPKPEVRRLALEHNLLTATKKDSTGICFVGKRDFPEFLSNYIKPNPGEFQTLDGKRQGEHQGVAFYTLGQRRGMGLGGPGEPWFVVGKNVEKNVVYVERGTQHPALFADTLTATEPTWIAGTPPKTPFRCKAKVRYRQKDQDCTLVEASDHKLIVEFDHPQRAITPRQSVVFYDGNTCLGGAMIEQPGPTYHQRGLSLSTEISA